MDATVQRRIVELAKLFGLEALLDRGTSSLSGPARGNVLLLLRALAAQPKVLLMDEPTASLDMISKDQLASIDWSHRKAQRLKR